MIRLVSHESILRDIWRDLKRLGLEIESQTSWSDSVDAGINLKGGKISISVGQNYYSVSKQVGKGKNIAIISVDGKGNLAKEIAEVKKAK